MTSERIPTAVDALADRYLVATAELDPLAATAMGLSGYDHLIGDYSPAGLAAQTALDRATLRELDTVEVADDVDRVTVAAMRERLGLQVELAEAGEHLASLNNIASPVQDLRDVFDIMPTATEQDWANIASRMAGLPGAVDGYVESLRAGAAQGNAAARRQVAEAATQARELAEPTTSFFRTFVDGAPADLPAGLRASLDAAAVGAIGAYATLADFLAGDMAALARPEDAAGRERYALWSRYFLGATVDLDATYAWGLEELARVVAEQQAIAHEVAGPDASIEDAVAALDADPARKLHGTAALQAWMQETSDAAIAALDGTHFTVAEPLRTLECKIAPTQTGGIYYTGPSDDFTRPGRMWWSVPPGVEEFNTWRELTTVYHEGIPGHHLQVGQAVFQRATLNSWRRLGCWVSGHGEGWALYAERLMADLGFLDDPGDRLGMLDAQRLRAARVVVDLGMHLQLPCPPEWGGGTWDADKGWEFLRANVNMPEEFVRFELNRYLGWPGQAPSYKVGQRLWEQARDAARAAAAARGEELDLRAFHERALNLGSVGLDVLREALT